MSVRMSRSARPKTILVMSQVYVPDPASVGQHMADAAAELARRGHRVVVLASGRGYDDPTVKYPARETLDGVEVRRLPMSSFGKRSIPVRLAGQGLFLAQVIVRGLLMRRVDGIVVSTSPPMCSIAALIVSWVRGAPITYWAMDLNPDQVVALGKVKEGALAVRAFEWLNRRILGRARAIVALDRFMKGRLVRKLPAAEGKIAVMPPWPLEDYELVPHERNTFRAVHNLGGPLESGGKFVVMYSGNHGPTNPIGTLLEAAVRLKDDKRFVFMFVGGGIGKKDVERVMREHPDASIVSLPYQPMSELKYSLGAADVHLVTVGNEAVGIVHPCKVYGAMAVGRPVLLLGPRPCHVSEILERFDIGWHVEHGDVEGAVRTLRQLVEAPREELAAKGRRAREAISAELSKGALCGGFCDIVEGAIAGGAGAEPAPATGPAAQTRTAN